MVGGIWTSGVALPLFLLLSSVEGGMLMHSGGLLRGTAWSHGMPMARNPSPPSTPVKHHLGHFQMLNHTSESIGSRGSSSLQISNMAPVYHCTRDGIFTTSGSCGDYYQCEHQSQSGLYSVHLLSCPLGTAFDATSNSCDVVSRDMMRPECLANESTTKLIHFRPNSGLGINSLIGYSANDAPVLKRRKRIAVMTALTAAIAVGSLVSAANGITGTVLSNKKKSGGVDLKGIENKLAGIDGKLKNVELAVLEGQIKNQINSETIQSLIVEGSERNQANFWVTQNLINKGILENRLRTAAIQGLIAQGNINNQLNFANVQVSIGELKQFINQEITKANADIRKGFESVSDSIDRSRIEPLVSKLLTLIRGYGERSNHIQSISENNRKDEIERSAGYLEYLESSTLQDTLYDIINQNLAIPTSASDVNAVFLLDFLVHGLQVHTSMKSSIVSSNVYLAAKSLDDKNLDEFNTYMLRISSSLSRVMLALSGSQGLIEKVRGVLNRVQNLPFVSNIPGFTELLTEKRADLDRLESDIEALITDNTELSEPGTIRGKPVFTSSAVSVPIGPWENGKQVSYAIQHVSERGLSKVGTWSTPFTVQDKANPTIQLPSAELGIARLVYRRFNQEKPELIAVVTVTGQTVVKDIGRDLLNAAARPNEELAVKETTALVNDGADVNIAIENKMTPLHYAAKHGNVRVMDILLEKTADIHAKTTDNEEALHFAALFGAMEGVEYLLNKGARVNSQSRLLGLSALHIAVANSHVDAAQSLISKGAFINIKDNNGLTPLHVSIAGNGDTIDVLLEEATIDINAVAEDGLTPLHYAARSSSEVFIQKLLQHRDIDVNSRSDSSVTPLHLAAMSGNVLIISELIKAGASVSAADIYGSTPLHYAAFYGNRDAVLTFIQVDESLRNIKNSEDKTALDLAVENNRESVIDVLRSSVDTLVEVLKRELVGKFVDSDSTDSVIVVPSVPGHERKATTNCSREVVEQMAKSSEETCVHIGHIESYVTLVMSMIPLQIYYESQQEFSQIFGNYDHDLGIAKSHAKIWRNGDSIVSGIRQTFELAKQFEPEFSRKYKINQKRVEVIKDNVDQVKIINATKNDIKRLEEELVNATEAMNQVKVEAVLQYFQIAVNNIETQLNEKKRMLNEDFILIGEMEELVDFLEFVRSDSSKIRAIALKTKGKLETFRDDLEHDKSAFERHGRIASESFEELQNRTIANNKALAEFKEKQEELEIKIEEERQEAKALQAKIIESHEHLRDMRRKLLDKMSKTKTMKIIGAILSPGLIGLGLLIYASTEEKKYAKLLQTTISSNKETVDVLESQIKSKHNQVTLFQEMIANSTTNSDKVKNEMLDFITLDGDLKTLASEVETLLQAINKALVGVRVIKDVFDGVTKKLGEMIDLAKTAKTEAERLNAKYFIYNELSLLECNWRDVYIKVMNLDECTRNFEVLY